MVNAEKWCVKMKKWRRCQLVIAQFYVLLALSSHLAVFSKLHIMNSEHRFAFSPAMSVMP